MSSTPPKSEADAPEKPRRHFIQQAIDEDLERGRFSEVVTRFPPEPNGYLHIGHAKAICVDFGLAEEFGGRCNLRFDDTNPAKEETEFVDAICEDIRWLGFEWSDEVLFASNYFETLYEYARKLIEADKAYVDDSTPEEIRELRDTLTTPGRNGPFRDRAPEESLDLVARMRAGEFDEGSRVLRAKIDMASPNLNLRDPVMYRISKVHHHRTGNDWCIYPMYDFAHGQSDSIEGITHSLCSLEFENHRPLYDWFCESLGIHHPRQLEFARLELTYLMTSKRKLRRLVDEGYVSGWDDPRMPTLRGLRRRGYTARSIRSLCETVGVAKFNSRVDITLLENAIREDLNKSAARYMAVLKPLKLVITNYPEDQEENVSAVNNPEDPDAGRREVPFCRELWIEADDFREEAPRKYFRLTPGREVRLRYAYYVTCTDFVKDDAGEVVEVHCTYDPESRGGRSEDGRKVKGTIHWVSARHAVEAEVRLYDRLFASEIPEKAPDGEDLHRQPQPRILGDRHRLARARTRDALEWNSGAIRATRLLLCRSRHLGGAAGPQPYRHASGLLVEDREEGAEELSALLEAIRPGRVVGAAPTTLAPPAKNSHSQNLEIIPDPENMGLHFANNCLPFHETEIALKANEGRRGGWATEFAGETGIVGFTSARWPRGCLTMKPTSPSRWLGEVSDSVSKRLCEVNRERPFEFEHELGGRARRAQYEVEINAKIGDPSMSGEHDGSGGLRGTGWREQLDASERVLREDPANCEASRVRIQCRVAVGSERDPVGAMTRHLEAHASDAAGWNLLSAYYCQARDGHRAVEAADAALRLEPDREIFRYNRACGLALVGDYSEAIRDLRRAVECDADLIGFLSADESLVELHGLPEFEHLRRRAPEEA